VKHLRSEYRVDKHHATEGPAVRWTSPGRPRPTRTDGRSKVTGKLRSPGIHNGTRVRRIDAFLFFRFRSFEMCLHDPYVRRAGNVTRRMYREWPRCNVQIVGRVIKRKYTERCTIQTVFLHTFISDVTSPDF